MDSRSQVVQFAPPDTEPIELINNATGRKFYDTLHRQAVSFPECVPPKCHGRFLSKEPARNSPKSVQTVVEEAKPFFDDYFRSIERENSRNHLKRWKIVISEINKSGGYHMLYGELQYGVQMAWRNSNKCIGRGEFANLMVFDQRKANNPKDIFDAICHQLRYAFNGGDVRNSITVFGRRKKYEKEIRIWNPELIAYAGYEREDGTIVGDKRNLTITKAAQILGWIGEGTEFDVLPVIIQVRDEEPVFYDLPYDCVLQIPIEHPQYPWFEQLRLRWHAVPSCADMKLDVGGMEFTAVPFNGTYSVSQVGSRNLARRCNLIEKVAELMGLNCTSTTELWRDMAALEIDVAVQHSFEARRIKLLAYSELHDMFNVYLTMEYERRGGCPGDLLYLLPPNAASLYALYHQQMLVYQLKPSFEHQVPWTKDTWGAEDPSTCTTKKLETTTSTSTSFQAGFDYLGVSAKLIHTWGKASSLAQELKRTFSHRFEVEVVPMAEFDVPSLKYDRVLLIIASDLPPTSGVRHEHGQTGFVKELMAMVTQEESQTKSEHVQLPLSKLRFSIFAIGPKVSLFYEHLQEYLQKLGAVLVSPIGCQVSFDKWSCETYERMCTEYIMPTKIHVMNNGQKLHGVSFKVVEEIDGTTDKCLFLTEPIEENSIIMPVNKEKEVAALVSKTRLYAGQKINLIVERIEEYEGSTRVHTFRTSLKDLLFSHYDCSSPPSMVFLGKLVAKASRKRDIRRLNLLSKNEEFYRSWVARFPTLLSAIRRFRSLKIDVNFLIENLPTKTRCFNPIREGTDEKPNQTPA